MIKFLNLVHASNVSIRIRSTRKQSLKFPLELTKIKQQEFLFVLSFVRFLAYVWTMILCLRRSLCHRLDFISLFCLLFCPYAYAYIQVQTLLVIAWSIGHMLFSQTLSGGRSSWPKWRILMTVFNKECGRRLLLLGTLWSKTSTWTTTSFKQKNSSWQTKRMNKFYSPEHSQYRRRCA